MGGQRELIELLTAQVPALGHHLGAGTLIERLNAVTTQHPGTVRLPNGASGAQRYPRHRLHATGDREIVSTRHHAHDRELDRLVARTAGAVDRDSRNRFRPSRSERCEPSDVARLVPELRDTSPEHVVDNLR